MLYFRNVQYAYKNVFTEKTINVLCHQDLYICNSLHVLFLFLRVDADKRSCFKVVLFQELDCSQC